MRDQNNITVAITIIIKSEVWTITHCLGLGHEKMVPVVCIFILLTDVLSTPTASQ